MSTTFTEADRKKLEALKAKERQAKQDERNEQKRADTICKKLFGMTAKQVQEKLSAKEIKPYNIYEDKLNEIADLYGTDVWTLIDYIKSDRQVSYYKKYHTDTDTIL